MLKLMQTSMSSDFCIIAVFVCFAVGVITTLLLYSHIYQHITPTQQTTIWHAQTSVQQNNDPIHILFEIANSELRQALIKQHGGFESLLAKTKHDVLHTDEYGVLFRVYASKLNRWYYYVKVINGTVENDGSRREYYKEVPADMDTAKEAVAWTYGIHPDDYCVLKRT